MRTCSYVRNFFATCWVLAAPSVVAQSVEKPTEAVQSAPPMMEVGLAFAGQYRNHYRGSEQTELQTLPIPYFIYRGEVIKAERGGVRADFFANKKWELNFSAAGALGADSDNNRLREGMPELDTAIELGPSLNVNLTGETFRDGWQFRLPVRAVFTVGSGVDAIGYTATPQFTFHQKPFWGGWAASYDVGAFFASDKYHDYYYSVESEYVTPERELYDAEAGFSGVFVEGTLFRRMKSGTIFAVSLQYDSLAGTVFEDSPLVETEHYFSLSFVVAKSFWKKYR